MEVAPGVHRLGNEIVNYYLIEADGGLTLVDAGLPAFRGRLEAFLRRARPDAVGHRRAAAHPRARRPPRHRRGRPPGRRSGPHPRGRRRAGANREVAPARRQHAAVLPASRDLAAARHGGAQRRDEARSRSPRSRRSARASSTCRAGRASIHTPGHSPGHIGVPLRRPGRADRRRRAVHLEPADRPDGAAAHAEARSRSRIHRRWSRSAGSSRSTRERCSSAMAIRGPPAWTRPSRERARPARARSSQVSHSGVMHAGVAAAFA